MKVKVIKATLDSYWYAYEIGKIYDVEEVKLENHKFKYKVVGSEPVGTKYFYEDDVKITNEEKTMKKSDLKSGMRIVHGKHDRHEDQFAIVVVDTGKIFFADGGWNYLDSYEEDLTMGSGSVWNITEVYDVPDFGMLNFEVKGDLLWKRETKTPEQKQLDIVMQQINALQKEAEKLQQVVTEASK